MPELQTGFRRIEAGAVAGESEVGLGDALFLGSGFLPAAGVGGEFEEDGGGVGALVAGYGGEVARDSGVEVPGGGVGRGRGGVVGENGVGVPGGDVEGGDGGVAGEEHVGVPGDVDGGDVDGGWGGECEGHGVDGR